MASAKVTSEHAEAHRPGNLPRYPQRHGDRWDMTATGLASVITRLDPETNRLMR
jgi:hypothetical protein